MALKYHQALFDLLRMEPKPSQRAAAALDERERVLGITLPASVREFYSLEGASEILWKNSHEDPAVPVQLLGTPDDVAHGVIRFQGANQGLVTWFVRLDGSDDPPVEYAGERDYRTPPSAADEDEAYWDIVVLKPEGERFSRFIYERVLAFGGNPDEREAAEMLSQCGAFIEFDAKGRAERVSLDLKPTAPPEPGEEPREACEPAAAMKLVRALTHVKSLWVNSAKVPVDGWAAIRDHPRIVELKDSGSLDDAGAQHVAAMPALRSLSVFNERLTDDGLKALLKSHQFTSFETGTSPKLTGRGLAALSTQKKLRSLTLTDANGPLPDAALVGLAGLDALQTLHLVSDAATDDGLRHLAGLAKLTRLTLALKQMTDAGLQHLGGLRSLVELRIYPAVSLSGSGFRHMEALGELKSLHLEELPIVDSSLAHFAAFSNLETLSLRETKVVGPGFKHLAGLAKLRTLNCRWNATTDAGLRHLADLPALQTLDISGAKITDAGLRALAPLHSLRTLDLTGTTVSAAAIRDLKAAIPRLKSVIWTRPGNSPDTSNPFNFRARAGEE